MADCFLSYSRPDTAVAERIAAILERQGISVWHWTRDMIHSVPHPDQTFSQIDEASCFICIVSKSTLETDFVFPEILHASSKHKPFVVILNGLAYCDLERERSRWCQAFGFAPALEWRSQDEQSLTTKLLRAMRAVPATGTVAVADRRATVAFQMGRLVFILTLLEAGKDGGQVSASEIDKVRQKILGFYSLVFGSDCEEEAARSGPSLMLACEKTLIVAPPTVDAAYWIGALMQVYQLAHGNIASFASQLTVLARDRARVLQNLPHGSRVQEAAAVLYDHAAKQASPSDAELSWACEVLQRYYQA